MSPSLPVQIGIAAGLFPIIGFLFFAYVNSLKERIKVADERYVEAEAELKEAREWLRKEAMPMMFQTTEALKRTTEMIYNSAGRNASGGGS